MISAVSNSDHEWYLAQFRPNCAHIAKTNLERQGFEVFLPLERETRPIRGKLVEKTRPFFPGYLFIAQAAGSAMIRKIRSTFGISQLVSFGNQPAIVPADLIAQLKQRCSGDGIFRPEVHFKKGDIVRMANGPFTDFVGEIASIDARRRLWVLLDILGQKTRVSIAELDVRAIA